MASLGLESVLVLISGEESPSDAQALTFVTRAQELSFTSCSGVLLPADEGSSGRLVLVPASSLARWVKPGAKWPLTTRSTSPPPLAPGCAICAAGSAALGNGRAALLLPIATFSVAGAQRAASALLLGLNRDATTDTARWNFAWSIAATAEASAAEQSAYVLCYAQPLPDAPRTSPAPPAPVPQPDLLAAVAPLLRSLHALLLPPGGSVAAGACRAGGGCSAPAPAPPPGPGRLVTVVGSPFGCLAPFHFLNAHVNGAIACSFPPPHPHPHQHQQLQAPGAPGPEPAATTAAPPAQQQQQWQQLQPQPALYALDAHVFPGMEGAPVTPLQLPLASLTGGLPPAPTAAAPGCGCGSASSAALPSSHQSWVQQCSGAGCMRCACAGGGSGGGGADPARRWQRPVALLATPLCRQSDGVQVPLAVAWPNIEAALRELLQRLLAQVDGAGGAGGGGGAAAAQQQQLLQLQPVSGSLAGALVGGAWGSSASGGVGERRPWWDLTRMLPSGWGGEADPFAGGGGGGLGTLQWRRHHPHTTAAIGTGGGGGGSFSSCAASVSLDPCAGPPGGFDGACAPSALTPIASASGIRYSPALVSRQAANAASAFRHPPAPHGHQQQHQHQHQQQPRMSVAAMAPSAPSYSSACAPACSGGTCGGGSAATGAAPGAELPPWALDAVVLLRCSGSWATGVLVESRSGLLVTTAHLFQRQNTSGSSSNGGGSNSRSGNGTSGRHALDGSDSSAWEHVVCWARVRCIRQGGYGGWYGGGGGGSGSGSGAGATSHRWIRAKVVYVWNNHLDLAVLQLESTHGGRWGVAPSPLESMGRGAVGGGGGGGAGLAAAAITATARAREEDAESARSNSSGSGSSGGASASANGGRNLNVAGLFEAAAGVAAELNSDVPALIHPQHLHPQPQQQPAEMAALPLGAAGSYGSGTPVWAVGHSLVGPGAEWPPLVSFGNVARVLRGGDGQPTMIIATTTTHAGGSGGALLDGAGRLVGLVTSNARHAGGATLPNMAFCIAAEELEPVLRWAAQRARLMQEQGQGTEGGESAAQLPPLPPLATLDGGRQQQQLRPEQEQEQERPRDQREPMRQPAAAPWGHGGKQGPGGVAAAGSSSISSSSGSPPLQPAAAVAAPPARALAALDVRNEDASRIWRLQMPSFGPLHQAAARAAMTAGAAAGAAAAVAQSAPPTTRTQTAAAVSAVASGSGQVAAADDGGVSATLRAIEVVRSWRSRL